MMKKTVLISGLASMFAMLAAPAVNAEEITLYSWREQEIPLWEHISEAGLIDDVTIKFVRIPGDNYDTKLRIDLQSGGPDIFQGRAGAAWLASFIDAGILKPLDESIDINKMAPASVSAAQGADGKVYGVPFAIQMQSILYNKAVFEQHGIQIPTTLDELNTAAATLKDAGVTPFSFGARSGWWLNQVVGEVMTAGLVPDETAAKLISGEACFTDSEYVSTLLQVKSWVDDGLLNANPMADDYGSMRTTVALGEAAMMIDGVWSSGPASPMFEIDPDLQLGFMAVPGDSSEVYAFGDGSYLPNAQSDKAASANKVLAYTTTEEFAKLFAQYVGELSAFGGTYQIDDARLASVAELIQKSGYSQTPFFAYALNAGEPSFGQLVADGYQELLSGSVEPEAVAQKIQDGLNSWDYVGKQHCS